MVDLEKRFIDIRKKILEKEYSNLNSKQLEAVFTVNGPVLVLAGAGSGKTTAIISRIEFLCKYGNAYYSESAPAGITEKNIKLLESVLADPDPDYTGVRGLISESPASPWNILAITFTNKAAGELKERLHAKLGADGQKVAAGTFHSACLNILRREADRLQYRSRFTIYDTDDGARVIKDVLSKLEISENKFTPKGVLNEISRAKNRLLTPAEYAEQTEGDFYKETVAKIYAQYQERLVTASALDFDDIIMQTVLLFQNHSDVLSHYQNLYKYVLVDEYQDTNHAQYKLVSLLAAKHKNICVVGDDDQSIYKFRGATIENILGFEKEFDAKVVRLEQNYRSTCTILDAANAVIKNNIGRKGKNLWTDQEGGVKINVRRVRDENREAEIIANSIGTGIAAGDKFSDFAILYRINAQSAGLEKHFARRGIPYRIVGATKFFDRIEIKDLISYMCVIDNPYDNVRLRRILNTPKRGIGNSSISNLNTVMARENISLYDAIRDCHLYPELASKVPTFQALCDMFSTLAEISKGELGEFFDELMLRTAYATHVAGLEGDPKTRLENIGELKTMLVKYEEEADEPSLSGFLQEIALYTDLDKLNQSDDCVTLMTVHSAKGLEFNNVFLCAMEEGVFPSANAQEEEEIEEERRLAYVGITRARKSLFITACAQRMVFGSTKYARQSRFIDEIPEELCEAVDDSVVKYNIDIDRRPKINVSQSFSSTVKKPDKAKAPDTTYTAGMNVSHPVFGKGTIVSSKAMGGDSLLEVSFEKGGSKKIMAKYAKLTIEEAIA